MEFSSRGGEEFYNLFAKVTGFSVRKDDVKRDKNQNIVSRKWVCSKEGYRHRVCLENENRKREPKAVTRIGCEATFRIGFNKQMNKWVVKEFMADHNHPLVEQKYKAQLNAMRGVGIGTSQIMDYMVQQLGGYNNVGFTKKDLYNHVDADHIVHLRDGDAEGALAYLCGKSEMDPSFYYKYNVDEDNHLANLFWAILLKPRHCGKCKKVGHTVRKCPEFVNTHNAFINIEDSIEDMVWDMPSLLNHNMEGGSRHGTNEFSQNTTLGTFQNGPETSLNDSWLGLHPPNYFTNQVTMNHFTSGISGASSTYHNQ
ncbi:hypothetical protein AAG906_010764 [Vitis piasezkii]